MAAFQTFLRVLKWKMDEKWKRIHRPWVLLRSPGELHQVALPKSRLIQRFLRLLAHDLLVKCFLELSLVFMHCALIMITLNHALI